MRRPFAVTLSLLLLAGAIPVSAATGKVSKVLSFFLDKKGQHALSPSLYDRDAYQAHLRKVPEERSGMRFDVLWKAPDAFNPKVKIRLELRGTAEGNLPHQTKLETDVKHGSGSKWTTLKLTGPEYKKLGEVTAWRATVWDGDQLVAEQKSFLW